MFMFSGHGSTLVSLIERDLAKAVVDADAEHTNNEAEKKEKQDENKEENKEQDTEQG